MKVLLINGSPRANGNTARALKEVADTLAADPELAPLAEDILRNNAMRLFGAEETR